MSPDERQMLEGLFERIRAAAGGQRDAEAEGFIANAVKAQPYAPYMLAQTVLVQEQTMNAAGQRLQELEAQVKSLQAAAAAQPKEPTSFLGSLGKSIFASPSAPVAAPRSAPAPMQGGAPAGGPWGQQAAPQQQYAPPQMMGAAPSMMGAAPSMMGGGGFMKGALGAAAGVAGGMLLANSLSGMLGGGHHGMGGQNAFDANAGQGDTVVNNYYGDSARGTDNTSFASADDLRAQDAAQDAQQDAQDDTQPASYDDSSSSFGGDDGSTDV